MTSVRAKTPCGNSVTRRHQVTIVPQVRLNYTCGPETDQPSKVQALDVHYVTHADINVRSPTKD
eukprot:3458648-Amphidinium_carterae.1